MKKAFKTFITLVMAFCMILSLAACGDSSGKDEGKAARDDLNYCIAFAEPGAYNNWKTGATLASGPVLAAVMESLVENVDGEWIWVLATGYEMVDDLTVRLHLRENVKFHNGDTMTADDVVYCCELTQNGVMSGAAWEFIDGYEAEDDNTVIFHLNKQSSNFNNILSGVSITSKKYYEEVGSEGFSTHPMGTDYYQWDNFVPGDSVTLKAFDEYWGEHGNIKTVNFRFISEASQALIELENGNIDFMSANGSTLKSIEGNDKLKVEKLQDMIVEYLGFNFNSEKVQDIRVREAVAHAIDRDDINIGAREGLCEVADSFLVPSHGPKYNPDAANYYEYDLEKAKALMTEAGYSASNPLHVKVMTDTQVQRSLEAQQIKQMLGQVYFDVEIQTFEAAAFNDIIRGGDPEWYDMLIRGVGVQLGEPIQQIYTICSPDGTKAKTNPMQMTEDSHPKAKEFNEKILEYMSKMKLEDQIPIAHELQILDREILEQVWLFNRVSYYVMDAKLDCVPRGSNMDIVRANWEA